MPVTACCGSAAARSTFCARLEGASILLGHVREGEWLGEMAVIENRSHSATARAAEDGAVEVLTAQQFLDQVSSDPALARDLILRLSVRLRKIEDKIAGDLLPFAHGRLPDGPDGTALDAVIAKNATIALDAQTDVLRARIGAVPIQIVKLPYVVGRVPLAGEAQPGRPDLLIEDEKPFRLSRVHFMIVRSGDRLLISDLGSRLGTIVNGQAIGHHFARNEALLHGGINHVVAGGWGSPFEFMVSVG
jgi:CRP/FNR family transcriptional regulator, cyclic AMP receptor protein